jgi:universal stress protein E
MFKRVLVATEESHFSPQPLEKSAALCAKDAHIEWFQSVYNASFEQATDSDAESQESALQLFIQHRLNQAEAHIDECDLPQQVVPDIRWHPSFLKAALEQSQRYQPELMVVPRIQRHDLLDWLVGGDEQELVNQLHEPLLLVNDKPWGVHPRVAVAIDPFHLDSRDDTLEKKLLGYADRIANQLCAELHVVHCFQALPQSVIFDEHLVTDFDSLQTQVGEEHRARIEELLKPLDRPLGKPLLKLMVGETDEQLQRFCEEEQIDILILGAPEKGWVERLLMGSTTARLLNKLDQDLLIIHGF